MKRTIDAKVLEGNSAVLEALSFAYRLERCTLDDFQSRGLSVGARALLDKGYLRRESGEDTAAEGGVIITDTGKRLYEQALKYAATVLKLDTSTPQTSPP
ncbi:hypothetical protein HYV81_04435 [Candidatus Woesearchaeota archaeon]|nr:hypothetical protein [Candidatus Woesearchaeota archaeon]